MIRPKSFFVPTKENRQKPYLLSKVAIIFYTFVLVFVNSFGGLIGLSEVEASSITPENIIALTNQERLGYGLNTLSTNAQLSAAALAKANDMFEKQYWDHFGPNGESPWQFIRAAGYNYVYAGENLAKGFRTAEGVHEAWMASPTHKANIVSGNYKDIGVAVVEGELLGKQTTLVVQLFAAPINAISSLEKINSQSSKPAVEAYAQANEQVQALPTPTPSVKTEAQEVTTVISPLTITKTISAVIFAVLIFALIADLYIIRKKKVNRISGKNLAHAGFLAVILLLIILSQQGVIS